MRDAQVRMLMKSVQEKEEEKKKKKAQEYLGTFSSTTSFFFCLFSRESVKRGARQRRGKKATH
jgi:hypothetical protein